MDGSESVDGLDFKHQTFADQKIKSGFADTLALVVDRDGDLRPERSFPELQLDGHRQLVDRFDEPGTEVPVHFGGTANYLGRQPIEFCIGLGQPGGLWRRGVVAFHIKNIGRARTKLRSRRS